MTSSLEILTGDLRKAAEAGNPFAQFEIALSLDYGNDGEQNFTSAAEWYSKAAAQGHTSAEGNLLLQHIFGQAQIWAPEEVFKRLLELAGSGDTEWENNVGLCYQHGFGTPQDYEKAVEWYTRAAHGGSGTAQFNLGGMYYEGTGVEKNLDLAVRWYTRSAQQREELALLHLGSMYQKGIGVETDLTRARVLYSVAYRLGSSRAANHLGILFKRGLGVERNDFLAYQLFQESITRPDTPNAEENRSYRGTACYWLGYMTEHGEGVERDLRKARKWYKQGAACGQPKCVEAVARLGADTRGKQCRDATL